MVAGRPQHEAEVQSVVFMSSPVLLSLGYQLDALSAFLQQEWQPDSPEGLFALHVYEVAGESGPVTGWPEGPDPATFRLGDAPTLATAGYKLSRAGGLRPTDVVDSWRAGIQRLTEKNPFPADRQTFVFRPLELYGLSLGAEKLLINDEPGRRWLCEVVRKLESLTHGGNWPRMISWIAAGHLGVNWSSSVSPPTSDQPPEELALLRWLTSTTPAGKILPFDPRMLDELLLGRVVVTDLRPDDVARAAVLHHAIRRAINERLRSDLAATWQVSRPNRDAVSLVANTCRRFPLFAVQLQTRHGKRKKHTFTDEYDVQDAMHALLRLYFDDVRAEEVSPSYAGSSSRIDFLLKREKVVVEVKMTRRDLKQKDVANQLIEDKERYRTHPAFRTLVCFVYDPEGYCNNPTALEADVSQDTDDFEVVVVVAPKGV